MTGRGRSAGVRAGQLLRDLRRYPTDLALLSVSVLVGILAAVQLPSGSTLRFLLTLPVLFLAPGYAVISFLHPSTESLPIRKMSKTGSRVALSFGLSLAVIPVVILVIGALGELGLFIVVGSLGIGTFGLLQLAAIRRVTVAENRRYQFSVRQNLRQLTNVLNRRDYISKFTAALLIVGVIASTSTLAFAIANPPSANNFTQFYLGTEGGNGTVTTANFPENLTEESTLIFGVTNHEQTSEKYVVVVQLQEVGDSGGVLESEELDRFENTVEAGETWQQDHQLAPEMTGEELRLQYLLFLGNPPEMPTEENAYRETHIWVSARADETNSLDS